MTSIRLEKISKSFGQTVVLHEIDLQIAAGELFFLLGPSGCGKSTLLRIIAGLLEPSGGQIFFNDRNVTKLGTESRSAVMCFQSYALWPHMSVRENVRFGLDVKKLDRAAQEKRIAQVLDLVQMQALADRKPGELSGGQQQRVALARAIAVEPACLLLDEPLSNIDAQLRQSMRSEIRRICKSSGLTAVYVTHDQGEALAAADRIAVMNDGRLMQVGAPAELYRRPGNAFVAGFLGGTNLLSGRVVDRAENAMTVETPIGLIRAPLDGKSIDAVALSIRPESLRIVGETSPGGWNRLSGELIESNFLGEASEHVVLVNGQRLKLWCAPPMVETNQKSIVLEFDPAAVVVLYN